jgi:hypothetical protein
VVTENFFCTGTSKLFVGDERKHDVAGVGSLCYGCCGDHDGGDPGLHILSATTINVAISMLG